MKSWTIEARPQVYARLAGLTYLFVILFGGYSEGVVMSALIVPDDAAATARNILGAESVWRMSVGGNLLVPILAVLQLWIEYLLLKPVSRNLALLFVLFNGVSLAIETVSKLFLLMVAPVLSDPGYAAVFAPDQVYALADLMLTAHDIAFHIALLFFGIACILSGSLIFRSGYLPKFLGVLMGLAGVSYLAATFGALFAPAFGQAISPWILLPVLVGESALCLWLLIMGVNLPRWRARLETPERA
ncbi:MAG: DUF4386 domain-containing protein [Alphaproteobacteria bacterium]|uniref:DUF4386 domain-containing protein n=1 Tax=Brevundimonas sp. TaxID=1871086 RepID=UPI0017C0F154|nr:DUF4386 domain-containing protein [Brevundimonas sp.]MBA3048770.1 DUF4386 domain-containing protein [Brevundimonas sp.]MBU3970553.1 DUF4386 domain-containing protein [Alphaproteobacteria bacterium]MBU4038771.1 DUF4386 domain-containing protein [Alphaproteobacteria bacterium]MBU4134840.1 DUF4386 domain-containing protein [Alphaproteobacteria bacterium]